MVLMVCVKPTIVLDYLCPGLVPVRLFGDLLADMAVDSSLEILVKFVLSNTLNCGMALEHKPVR